MRRIQIACVLVGLLALAGGGAAIAAMGHGDSKTGIRGGHRGDDFDAAASYLGTSTEQLLAQLRSGRTLAQVASATSGKSSAGLVAALVAHEKQELAGKVADGTLTQSQADQLAATLMQRFTDFVNGVRPPFPGRPHGDGLHVAAAYLGISVQTLATQLRSGKTLAQIASSTSGRSASGLVDALVADATTRFGTSAPADLRTRITQLVNGALPAFGPRGRHDRWFPGPRRRF
jgi:hypothetical protein